MIRLARVLVAISLMGLPGFAASAPSQGAPLNARVVWVRESHVYVASTDSMALEPGDRLSFTLRGKRIAAGEVTRVFEPGLAAAKLSAGSLERVKKLERVSIALEHPAPSAPQRLRVGFPSSHRSNPLFSCDRMSLRLPAALHAYRIDSLSEHSFRAARDSVTARSPLWPDTLVVRLFDESADEEIALERGELDVGVFWPGELSRQLRDQPWGRDFLTGTRSRGMVAAIESGAGTAGDGAGFVRSSFAALDRDRFRGDLGLWRDSIPGSNRWPGAAETRTIRFEVDPAFPGRRDIERALNRGQDSRTGRDSLAVVRVFYLDAPIHAPDSLAVAAAGLLRDRLRSESRDSSRVMFLSSIRCPIVSAPALRPYLSTLSTDALVDLLECAPVRRAP